MAKRFGATQALADVSLAVAAGETHALVGRNGAGKSTLVSILTGLTRPDAGEIRFDGEPAPAPTQRERWRSLAACVYQKSTVIPTLSVAENVVLNAYPAQRHGFIGWGTARREASELLAEWGLELDVRRPASTLTVDQRQLVEIARALRLGSRFIILDEPTAQLEAGEIARLFEHLARLRAAGVSCLYISHHLDEVFELCQTVTVLRDGRLVDTSPVAETTKDELVHAMVGAAGATGRAGGRRPAAAAAGATPRLDVRGLTVGTRCVDVSFSIGAGERVGLAGLSGSGKAEVADSIVGMLEPDRGTVLVDGRPLRPGSVHRAIEDGIGYVPQDRHARGLSPNLAVDENLTMSTLDRLGPAGLVAPRERTARAAGLIESLGIVTAGPRQCVAELSGGNQQKTVLGRALATGPRALVLVSPTAGVDIASKEALYERIQAIPDVAVLLVSDELDELAICDRVLVMFDGRIVHELGPAWEDDELVGAMEGVSGP